MTWFQIIACQGNIELKIRDVIEIVSERRDVVIRTFDHFVIRLRDLILLNDMPTTFS